MFTFKHSALEHVNYYKSWFCLMSNLFSWCKRTYTDIVLAVSFRFVMYYKHFVLLSTSYSLSFELIIHRIMQSTALFFVLKCTASRNHWFWQVFNICYHNCLTVIRIKNSGLFQCDLNLYDITSALDGTHPKVVLKSFKWNIKMQEKNWYPKSQKNYFHDVMSKL